MKYKSALLLYEREILDILFMLVAVPSVHGCVRMPKLGNIRDIMEASQQLL
jgi:hypothetical protein